jgi:hypothetical protein
MSVLMMNVHTCLRRVCRYQKGQLITLLTSWSDHYVRCMMNVHACFTDHTNYTMVWYMWDDCLIYLWIYTHVLQITLPMPCCMSDHFNSNCNSHNPQHSSILKYWNITQHVTSLSVIWRHCKHIVIAITIYDSLMHCRISMKPCPESINEKKEICSN